MGDVMKTEIVIRKTSCKAGNFADVNPAFFSENECLGCSFYHVCNKIRGTE